VRLLDRNCKGLKLNGSLSGEMCTALCETVLSAVVRNEWGVESGRETFRRVA